MRKICSENRDHYSSPLRLSSRWEVINGQSHLPTQVACNSLMGCLTCPDGPCVIKTRPGNPITISAGSAAAGGPGANLPKPKLSESKR